MNATAFSRAVAAALLLGTGTAATAAVTPIGLAGFSGGESVISYDTADWFLPVDGQIIDGVAHGFTMGGNSSTDATVDIGPGVLDYVEPFSVEGDATGVLTLAFGGPQTRIGFGWALSLAPPGGHSANVLVALNDGLCTALSTDESVYILGEDLLDPYGGAFKVTRRLSSDFPQRVLTTPISEAGFSGAAVGMALRGLRPVVEIMFGDFVTLAADQLVNHAAKFRWMYNGNKLPGEQVHLPLVLRTPMGGRRGYGPTHSQTLEKHLLGVPGLRVLAPTHLGDPRALLLAAILQSEDPTLFVENKLLYLLPLRPALAVDEFELHSLPLPAENAPTYRLALRGAPPPQITVATYGYMAELVSQAALRLAYENELFIEVIGPTQLAPFHLQPVIDSARRTGRLLTVEEGGFSLGWGAEVLAQTAEALGPRLTAARRLAALDLPIPSSGPLEQIVLPGVEQIIESCLKIAQRR